MRREEHQTPPKRKRAAKPPSSYIRYLAYLLTSPGAGVGLGAPELSFSAGILCEPAAPVVDGGDGFAFVPPVVPSGFRSTAPLLPPACSSICFVVPCALAAATPVIRAPATTRSHDSFHFVSSSSIGASIHGPNRVRTSGAPVHCSNCHRDLIVVDLRVSASDFVVSGQEQPVLQPSCVVCARTRGFRSSSNLVTLTRAAPKCDTQSRPKVQYREARAFPALGAFWPSPRLWASSNTLQSSAQWLLA